MVASKLVIQKPFFKGDDHDVSFANLPSPHPLPTFRASSPIYHSKQSTKRSVQVCLGSSEYHGRLWDLFSPLKASCVFNNVVLLIG